MRTEKDRATLARGAARGLLAAHESGVDFGAEEQAVAWGDDLRFAYDVQDEYVAALRAQRNTDVIGFKIGLTSAAMQQMCGISEPVAGQCLGDVVARSGSFVPLSRGGHIGVECEIAVLIKREVSTALATVEDALDVIEAVAPAMELVDDRNADYQRLNAAPLVADNAWNAGVVIGAFQYSWPDLASVRGEAWRFAAGSGTGKSIGHGAGRDILGHPGEAVRWLTWHLASRGQPLRAGSVVLTGSMVRTYFPSAGDRIEFLLAELGEVSVSFG